MHNNIQYEKTEKSFFCGFHARTRKNSISINEKLNEELVINLHSYVDTLFSEIITEILKSPYNDSIYDTISNHKLTVLIMDEKLKGLGKQDISAENARMFLYYDFSM